LRKVLNILLIIPLLYLIALPGYLFATINSRLCGGVEIVIKDSSEYHFVTKKQLLNIAYGIVPDLLGKPVRDIPVKLIEDRIKEIRELKEAEVYTGIDGILHIYVDQRNPVVRIMPDDGGDYFMDEDGVIIRRRNLYTPRLHVAGGDITISSAMLSGVSVLDTSIKKSVLKDIYYIVNYINDDNFWSAQIDQIFVDNNNIIDLIPRVGNHKIRIGSAENLDGKLRNLKTFYNDVLPSIGWNRYSMINLEYKDQIVCKKK
jgi:cell division protein FtsQ